MTYIDQGPAASFLGGCNVCGARDARQLTTVRLALGEVTTVCGTHDLMYKRSSLEASTVDELRSLLRDRRSPRDRRGQQIDDLGAMLSDAFASNQRTRQDRRR